MEKVKPILHLNLKKQWFDMIKAKIKKEEYRAITPYWSRIFHNGNIKIKGKHYHPTDVLICFSHGYSRNRPQLTVPCEGLRVRTGYEAWGAVNDEQYFVLKLGDNPDEPLPKQG